MQKTSQNTSKLRKRVAALQTDKFIFLVPYRVLSAIKRRASELNIPAWKLAEELTYHSPNGALVVKHESDEGNELNSY